MSPSTSWFGLNASSATVHTIDRPPISRVENVGVKKRGWIVPNAFGIEFHFAIESVVRAVGRIVVCVDADADVSTEMISSLSSGEPNTLVPSALRTSRGVVRRGTSCRGRPAPRR